MCRSNWDARVKILIFGQCCNYFCEHSNIRSALRFQVFRFSRHWNVQFAFEILGGAGFLRELWMFQSTLEFPSRLRGCQWHTSKATKVHAVCVVVFFNFLYSFNATGACRGWLGDGDSTRLTKLTGYTMCCPVQKVKAVVGI